MNRTVTDSLVAAAMFVTFLVVGLVVLVGGLIVAAGMLGNHVEPEEPPGPIDGTYIINGPFSCDTVTRPVPYLPLDAEPEAMLICADPDSSQPWTAPSELVEGDLGSLVDALGDLEDAPLPPRECTFGGGPAYDLVLRFSRERYARIHGDVGGCGVVTLDSSERLGAKKVLDAALALVETARQRRQPPGEVGSIDLSCDRLSADRGVPLSLTGDFSQTVRMVSCWQPDDRVLGAWRQTAATARETRVLVRDAVANASPQVDGSRLGCPGGKRTRYLQHLVGQTAWGDLVMVAGMCRTFQVTDVEGDEPAAVWRPSPESQRILDHLRH